MSNRENRLTPKITINGDQVYVVLSDPSKYSPVEFGYSGYEFDGPSRFRDADDFLSALYSETAIS